MLSFAAFFPTVPRPTAAIPSHIVSDSVAIDAKRILLRYGAPIAVLDKVSEVHRIEFAREISKTTLQNREGRLRELLVEKGYVEAKG